MPLQYHEQQHPPERLEALAAGRAEAYKLEVEELRVTVARAHLKIQQQADEHAGAVGALHAELEARGRGEMLARTRCEAAEAELRTLRREVARLRENAKREAAGKQQALAEGVAAQCRDALQSLARHGLRQAALSWRRRALRDGLSSWHSAAAAIEAEAATETAERMRRVAGSFARAEAAALEQPNGPEAWLRDVQRGYRARRLANWAASCYRESLGFALKEWKLATCAAAAEDDLRDVAGRLRSAQAGMVTVLDGRAAAEAELHRHGALARCAVSSSSLGLSPPHPPSASAPHPPSALLTFPRPSPPHPPWPLPSSPSLRPPRSAGSSSASRLSAECAERPRSAAPRCCTPSGRGSSSSSRSASKRLRGPPLACRRVLLLSLAPLP